MLQAEGLHLRRGSNEVLHDIHLQLSPGQVVGVLGPNGAGKSSLLGVLCGELAPDRGRVTLQGRPLADWAGPERARRGGVAAGVQHGVLVPGRGSGGHGAHAPWHRAAARRGNRRGGLAGGGCLAP